MASKATSRMAAALAILLTLAACGPTGRAHWAFQGPNSSPFAVTLYEDTYNSGESIIYTVRFEKKESGPGGGWFVTKELYGDDERPKRPTIVWTSPRDLTVIVHTARIDGRVVQRFVNPSGNDGSLTFEYRADGLEQ
jgi:hypothetical protein